MGAWQDSLPMIILSGQVRYEISIPKSGLSLRYRGIQEFSIIPTVKNMTKYAVMITDPLSIKRELVKAIQIAMDGRRGPVWVDIPQDIQNARVEEKSLYPAEKFMNSGFMLEREEVEEVLNAVQKSNRPCILIGSGIISTHTREAFSIFAERMKIPVIGGAWVADNFYLDYPFYFGASGNIGPRMGNFILQNADTIIVLGNSLGFRQTGFNQEGFAPKAKIYMVDIDKAEAQKPGLRIKQYIQADLKKFFDVANKSYIPIREHEEWINYCNRLKRHFDLFEVAKYAEMEERVCSHYFWKIFQQYEPENSILALGNNTANTARLQSGVQKKYQRVLTNYTCGAMGYDIPAAIGAAVASQREVICVTGDGSIMMNLQELQTIVQYDLSISIVIFNNGGYGAIRQTGKSFFKGEYIGCTPDTGVSFPEFQKIAETFGFQYLRCSSNQEVERCLKVLFYSKKRVLMEVMQAFDDPVIPKIMSKLDENGKMQASVLHDMYPFLNQQEMNEFMLWEERERKEK